MTATDTIFTTHWFRTAYDRKAHTLATSSRFTCGTPTGYGLLHRAYTDTTLLPDRPCAKCAAAHNTRKA